MGFLEELRQQRWDDHRFYHHHRANQTLHFFSSICFLASYVMVFANPAAAVFVGWLLAMVLRQLGHFVFEPRTYDEVNQASHEHQESVKVGYNLRRKTVLLTVWAGAPMLLWIDPTCFGLFAVQAGGATFFDRLAVLWLAIGIGAVVFRTVHLFFLKGVQSGLVWFTKILTDPFHDFLIYCRAPLYLLRGEMLDDMSDWYDESARTNEA